MPKFKFQYRRDLIATIVVEASDQFQAYVEASRISDKMKSDKMKVLNEDVSLEGEENDGNGNRDN